MSNYDKEIKARFGDTDAYKEYEIKTKQYSPDKLLKASQGLDAVFKRFAECKNGGKSADSDTAQSLVKALQEYISENFYTCTNKILAGLGQMYLCDERFKQNIDSHGEGTAEFVSQAIKRYCE